MKPWAILALSISLLVISASLGYQVSIWRLDRIAEESFDNPAWNAYRAGDFSLAETLFLGQLDRDKGNTFALEGIGRTYLAIGKSTSAIPFLETLLKIDPSGPGRYTLLGRAQSRASDITAALETLGTGLSWFPTDARLLEQLGWTRIEQGQILFTDGDIPAARDAFLKAGTTFAELSDFSPPPIHHHYLLGTGAYWREIARPVGQPRNFTDARRHLERQTLTLAHHVRTLELLGWIALHENRLEDALAHLTDARSRGTDRGSIFQALSVVAYRSGDYQAAADHARQAIPLYGKDAYLAWDDLGWALIKLNRSDEAREAFEASLEAKNWYSPHHGLGWVLFNEGNHEDAVESFTRSLAFKPDKSEAWLGLSASYAGLELNGEFASGWAEYSKASSIENYKNQQFTRCMASNQDADQAAKVLDCAIPT